LAFALSIFSSAFSIAAAARLDNVLPDREICLLCSGLVSEWALGERE